MTLDRLISKNRIKLTFKTKTFCRRGLELMRNSQDPAHNIRHIERMFSDLDIFLRKNKGFEIDFDTLLISISWHDVWMAKNFKPDLGLLWKAQIEGSEAARLVSSEMGKAGFNKGLIQKVTYCVERHTGPEADPNKRQSTESRILHDLDQMDSWSEGRLQEIKYYLSGSLKGRIFLRLLKTEIGKQKILSAADHGFYFRSSQKEKDRRYPKSRKRAIELFG